MQHQMRWTAKKIQQRLELVETLVYRRRHAIPPFRFLMLDDPLDPPIVDPAVDDQSWKVIEPYEYWVRPRTNFMLRSSFSIPAEWPGDQPVALFLPLGEAGDFSHPETLVYIDGAPLAAGDRHHQEVRLPDSLRDGQTHALALHGWSGNAFRTGPQSRLMMRPCEVVQIDPPTREFTILARVALGIADSLDANDPVQGALYNALDDAFKQVDIREPFTEAFYASIPGALNTLRDGVAAAGPALNVTITAAGHAHIDVAWLWTLGQTRRKAGRTFHTVLHLMKQFPSYHFTQSQPQLYDYVRQDYPELFEGIKQAVADGRWEPIGGMWVEADCNLSGPESLARQFVLGRGFFREHFGPGAESPVLWLPDVFGYAWALPQLIKQAGLEYFFTIKISWSQYNKLPYDSFWWQGLDGTRVLTHFSPIANYNCEVSPREVMDTWRNFKQKESQHEVLMSFGFGDGGGGPTREMIENLDALAHFPAAPQTRQGKVGDFFRRMEAECGDRLPTWSGELYLELHRGTYTTQSRNKRANRQSEFLLHDAEFAASLASLLDARYAYPAADLKKAWELVCLNQFHDIIPGSSITAVYAESQAQYAQVRALAEAARDGALEVVRAWVGGDVVLVNPSAFGRADLALWRGTVPPGSHLQTLLHHPVLTQPTDEGTLIASDHMKPLGVKALQIVEGAAPAFETGLKITPRTLENDLVRVEINDAGDIVRFTDKANGREVLPPGAVANQFQAFEDRPNNWDAWDIDIFYDDKQWLAEPADSIEVVAAGPLRATLKITRRILHSAYTQWISLDYNSPMIRIDTDIDWHERHVLLKAAFPVDVLAPQATYEIQWGNVERPTHRNTSWDWARFETVAQKWVDLSEGDYGVSLLNDCKYGHDIQGNVIRVSLLRSPTNPDPEADQGRHRFSLGLLPHAGTWRAGSTIPAAYALNDPLIAVDGTGRPGQPIHPLLTVDRENIVIETVKRAEDGRGLIVRLYESQRQRGTFTLAAGFELAAAAITNLIEEDQAPLEINGSAVTLPFRPYQIFTLRLVPSGQSSHQG